MEVIQGQLIEDQSVTIDGKEFRDCTLVRCVLKYSGDSVVFTRTQLKNCTYVFFGPARGTVHFLQSVGLMPYQPADWGEIPDNIH